MSEQILEEGFYWASLHIAKDARDREPQIMERHSRVPAETFWTTSGGWETFEDEHITVLSPRLLPPEDVSTATVHSDVGGVTDQTIVAQALRELAQQGGQDGG